MMTSIYRKWRRAWQDPQASGARATVGSLAGTLGLACNGILAAGKLILGAVTGSVAVAADGVNNLMDAASSAVTLAGFRLGKKPADREHPYGHARYEYLAALTVAVLVLVMGAEMAIESGKRIFTPRPVEATAASSLLLLAAVGVKLAMAAFYRRAARRIDSPALVAAAVDSRCDALATSVLLLSHAFGSRLPIPVDGIAGLGVAALIAVSGIRMTRDAVSLLLGRRADGELTRQIARIVLEQPGVLGFHDLLIHDYGPGQCFASLHAQLDLASPAARCHRVADALEHRVWEQLQVRLVIHVDPAEETE